MIDQIGSKIAQSNSLLLIIPSDMDRVALYAAMALAKSCEILKLQITILNDTLSNDANLIEQTTQLGLKTLTTKATRLYRMSLDKDQWQIKHTLIDESQKELKIAFESKFLNLDLPTILNLNTTKLNQDLIIILKSTKYSNNSKYVDIIESLDQQRVFTIENESGFLLQTILKLIENNKIQIQPPVATILLSEYLIEAKHQAYILPSEHPAFISKLIEYGADYTNAYKTANAFITSGNARLWQQSLDNIIDVGGGIFYSLVDNTQLKLPIPVTFYPLIQGLQGFRAGFVLIHNPIFNHVFLSIADQNLDFNLFKTKFPGEGDNYLYYFKTKSAQDIVVNELLSLLQVSNPSIQIPETITQNEIDKIEIKAQNLENKFTQGLPQPNPLTPAVVVLDNPVNPAVTQDNNTTPTTTVKEEC